jgi:hypothetical protein
MEKISWTDKVKTKGTAEEEYPTQNKGRKANWDGRILRGNYLLNYLIEGKTRKKP